MTRKEQANLALEERRSLRKVIRAERALLDSLVVAVQNSNLPDDLKTQVTVDFECLVLAQELHHIAFWDPYEKSLGAILEEDESVND